jgi:ParB family chromosome partitioning protein
LQGRRRLAGAFFIELARIRPDPSQPRRSHDDRAHQELTASIARLGVLQPIAVRYIQAEDIYQIISGERRYLATKAAGLSEMPCWVQAPKDEEILLRQLSENWQRAELHPFELADSLARLRDVNGYTQKDLAEATGKSPGEISKLLSLLDLDPAIQKEAREDQSGAVTRRHLYALTKLDAADQPEALAAIRVGHLTATDTDSMVSRRLAAHAKHRKRGSPVTKFQYVTSQATVHVTFRRATVESDDVLRALDEAKETIAKRNHPTKINIVRPK